MNKKSKNQAKKFANQNPVESLGNIIHGVGDSLAADLAGAGASDFFRQLLGIEQPKDKKQHHSGGDLHEGETLDLKKIKEAAAEPAIDYKSEIIHGERRASAHKDRETQAKIAEILAEIKRLLASSQELESQFKDVVVETPVAQIGKYHENFFEWVISVIKIARMRIEESAGWMSAMHSKKDRKYWAQFKKHGTTFGLSNERVVATQTG